MDISLSTGGGEGGDDGTGYRHEEFYCDETDCRAEEGWCCEEVCLNEKYGCSFGIPNYDPGIFSVGPYKY